MTKSITAEVTDEHDTILSERTYMECDDGSWLGPDDDEALSLEAVLAEIAKQVRR